MIALRLPSSRHDSSLKFGGLGDSSADFSAKSALQGKSILPGTHDRASVVGADRKFQWTGIHWSGHAVRGLFRERVPSGMSCLWLCWIEVHSTVDIKDYGPVRGLSATIFYSRTCPLKGFPSSWTDTFVNSKLLRNIRHTTPFFKLADHLNTCKGIKILYYSHKWTYDFTFTWRGCLEIRHSAFLLGCPALLRHYFCRPSCHYDSWHYDSDICICITFVLHLLLLYWSQIFLPNNFMAVWGKWRCSLSFAQ